MLAPQEPCSIDAYGESSYIADSDLGSFSSRLGYQFNPSYITPFYPSLSNAIRPEVGEYMGASHAYLGTTSSDQSVIVVPQAGCESCWSVIDSSHAPQGYDRSLHTRSMFNLCAVIYDPQNFNTYLHGAIPTELQHDDQTVETGISPTSLTEGDALRSEPPHESLEVRMPRPRRVHELNIVGILANLDALACDDWP